MAAKPVKVAFLADTADLRGALKQAEASMEQTAATAKSAGERIDTAFESTAGHADEVASKGSQAAGALSGLGDLVGGPFGTAMMTGGVAMQAFADAGDLVNVVTESAIVKKAKDAVVTSVQTARNIAAAAAQRGLAAASRAWAIAQRLVNAAMRANPIGLVITALLLLGAGLVAAYRKSQTFRNIVNGAFAAVKGVVTSVGGAFKTVWDNVSKWLGKAWDYIKGLPGKIRGVFSGLWSGLADGLKSALNSVLGLPLTIPRVNTHIPGVGTVGGQTLIPALANGGIVTRPTLALIGEAGPEAVVPLNRGGFGAGILEVRLSADAIDDLERGRTYARRIDTFKRAGGRTRAS